MHYAMALYQSLRSAHRIEAGASTRGFNRLLHGGRSLNHYAAAHKRMVTLSPTHPLTNNPDEVGLTWICLDLPSVPMRDDVPSTRTQCSLFVFYAPFCGHPFFDPSDRISGQRQLEIPFSDN